MLKKNTHLSKLILRNLLVTWGPELGEALSRNHKILNLDISNNVISPEGETALFDALYNWKNSLLTLNLAHLRLSYEGHLALYRSIVHNIRLTKHLEELNLNNNELPDFAFKFPNDFKWLCADRCPNLSILKLAKTRYNFDIFFNTVSLDTGPKLFQVTRSA